MKPKVAIITGASRGIGKAIAEKLVKENGLVDMKAENVVVSTGAKQSLVNTLMCLINPGDEVIIFGKNPPVEDLAKCMNTIPYEIFTNISDRVKRVYVQE